MTFFFNYMRPLIDKGMLYLAVPPLYRVRRGETYEYLASDEELVAYQKKYKNVEVQRFKG